jgi:nitrogenase subunit NifH
LGKSNGQQSTVAENTTMVNACKKMTFFALNSITPSLQKTKENDKIFFGGEGWRKLF